MPDSLASLEREYQVLTELYRTDGSVTYLARHLGLARDVTITVMAAASDREAAGLRQIESDVKTLMAVRHPNIVPVLEGRWIDARSFIVVRARVRGSTLDQLLSAIGAVPLARVKSTLDQVYAALAFARANGIAARRVGPESLVFQQGSGRVLVAFDSPPQSPPANRRAAAEHEDSRTVGRLARAMLLGSADAAADSTSLVELRPDLPTQLAGAADALALGGTDADVLAFIALLAAAAGVPNVPTVIPPTPGTAPITSVESGPGVRRATVARGTVGHESSPPSRSSAPLPSSPTPLPLPSPAVPAPPVSQPPNIVTPTNLVTPAGPRRATPPRRFGTGARWGMGIAIVLVVAAAGALAVLRPRFLSSNGTIAFPTDSAALATGDVAKKLSAPVSVAPTPPFADTTHPDSSGAAGVAAATTAVPPPGDTTAVASALPSSTTAVPAPAVSAPPSNVTANAACASTVPADQRKCFTDAVQRADGDLNRVYNALIGGLRRQAKSAPDDPDPPTVDKLRAAQRAWLDTRDRACQVVGGGLFSGRDRGQCFADQAAKRSRDLQQALDSLPPAA